MVFLNQGLARDHKIPLLELHGQRYSEVIDGRIIESLHISHLATVGMQMQNYKEQLPASVTGLGYYPIIQGITWLELHDVAVRSASNTVLVKSQYFMTYCHDLPVTVQVVME